MLFKFLIKLFGRREASLEEEAAPTATPDVVEDVAHVSATEADPVAPLAWDASAEELCDLRDGMTEDEMRAHLAKLYRRHNRAASSLNPELRDQAERMLDAIVEVRHRYLDHIEE